MSKELLKADVCTILKWKIRIKKAIKMANGFSNFKSMEQIHVSFKLLYFRRTLEKYVESMYVKIHIILLNKKAVEKQIQHCKNSKNGRGEKHRKGEPYLQISQIYNLQMFIRSQHWCNE